MRLTDWSSLEVYMILELKMWMINVSAMLGYESLYDALIFLSKSLWL